MKDEGNVKRVSPYRRLEEESFKVRIELDQMKHKLAITESNLRIAEGKCEAYKLIVHKLESRQEGYREGIEDALKLLWLDAEGPR